LLAACAGGVFLMAMGGLVVSIQFIIFVVLLVFIVVVVFVVINRALVVVGGPACMPGWEGSPGFWLFW
jgi:hypothetical protein